ncbi:Maturase [Actinidia chinensis var. chinensis]|uniref:Maturase n=1 Tax=Actinidia chinensis var. chinensis TaxID=1590841 RepID=A0A2R6QLG3_ACTCC|nr:Maturase [Actinidia chinensis var. chinensis]
METLISHSLNRYWVSQFQSSNFIFHFPSLSRENPHLPQRKWLYHPKTLTLCSATAADSPSYGGWDDSRLGSGSVNSGESNQLRNLLNSLGIDDKRYIFMYLLGFVCALAISRVRVSSIVVFPASVIVFAVGFSIGFVNGGHVNELSLIGAKKRPKDENIRVSVEKLRNLVDLLSGFDGKISNLKNGIRRGIVSNHISASDLESYVKVMESIGLSALNAKRVVEACIDSMSFEDQDLERTLNQKSSKRKKEMGETRFDVLQFISGLFLENSFGSKANKTKDSVKRDSVHVEMNDQTQGNILTPLVEENVLSSVPNDHARDRNVPFFAYTPNKTDSYRTNKLRFVNNRRISLETGCHNEVETWASHDNFLDSMDFRFDLKHMKTVASFEREQIFEKTNGSYSPSHNRENREKETYKHHSGEEERVISKDDPSLSGHKSDVGSFPSSTISEDIKFNTYLMEANALTKQARECLRVNGDERDAETVLYESVKLLSKAVDMKPMSLMAVGQLGNTYLLHGELKLKISRQLRDLLANRNPISIRKWGNLLNGLDDQFASKDRIASVLVNVCEECEELLVEAGRKYKLALSIDGDDMRAMYNWGLALSFRAQLIADIGPEAASDADKVFLAAIDKFDAMMSKSNVYTPDALFRWGVALQQRSRLRPRNSKEKVKLLQQAKRLYEDALDMDSDNLQVREALTSCISELSFRRF